MDERATIVCLHSSASSGAQWTALRALLGADVPIIAPDFHEHGTGPAWNGLDEDIVAADAARIAHLFATMPGDVHLVGHSYGGAIALRLALHHPERVASVAVYEPVSFRLLFDDHVLRRPVAEIIDVASRMRRHLRAGDKPGAAELFIDYWSGRGAWNALSDNQKASIAKRIGVITAQFGSLARDTPRLADYRALRAPVLMLAGPDPHKPVHRIAELLRSALPNAASDTIPGAGHMGPLTHASTVAQRIASFVRRHASIPDSFVPELAA